MTQTSAPQPILLKNYQAPAYFAKKVQLSFDLDPEKTLVTSRVSYVHNPGHPRSLQLAGHELKLLRAAIDQKPIALESLVYSGDSLQLDQLPASFELELLTEINPKANTALEGLYLSQNKFYTQCEPEGFRRITYFLDRPDVMAEYETTIRASIEQYPVLLSNGNLIEQGRTADGKHFAKWHDPFPKPSYLFALVAGNLHRMTEQFITKSGRKVDIHIYVEQQNLHKCSFALESIKRAMSWDEKVYGLEYDLDLFMVVAVSDFNMGAMENKGLNIFNAKYILASPDTATDEDFENVLAVIGHEYFHNWTGNRVTLRDWFQLSLKEGITVFRDQEFSADEGSRAVTRIGDVRQLREQQFAEDAGPMAHPVRPETYIEINNFYTSTVYNKGAEVIRMLYTIIGPQSFRKAMDLFFAKHDGQAVTVEDFLAVVETSSGQSLNQFKRWYQQAGTPRVAISRSYHAPSQSLSLNLSQQLPRTPEVATKQAQLIPMRVAMISKNGEPLETSYQGRLAHEHLIILDKDEAAFTLQGVPESAIPSLFRNFTAPVIVEAQLSREELYTLLRADTDPFNTYEVAQTLALQIIQSRAENPSSQQEAQLDPAYVASFRNLLRDTDRDPRLTAMLMQVPSAEYLMQQDMAAELDAIYHARLWLLQQLALSCKKELLQCYERTQAKQYSIASEAIGKRDLNNACLNLLAQLNTPESMALSELHFQKSHNMTDSMGALTAQAHIESPIRTACLKAFFERWQADPLVIDKWFQVQASAQHPKVLAHVKELLQHPAFDLKNPNRIYSIFRQFNKANPYGFHSSNGEGYAIVSDYVKHIDKYNPQVASMLANMFSRYRKFDPARQALMRKNLEDLAATPDLSRDVYEVLSKSLKPIVGN